MARRIKQPAEQPSEPVQGQEEPRYPAACLLNSQALSGYQQDFAKVLLGERDYTLQEARAVLERYFNGGEF